jgi:cytochrome P450
MTAELKEIVVIREALWSRMIQGGWTRHAWGQYLSIKTNGDLHDFKRQWADFNLRACRACASLRRGAAIVDMYSAVMEGKITLEQLLQTLDEMLFANLDVTMGGISWNLMFLAANPAIQAEIRNEISGAWARGVPSNEGRHRYLQSSSTLLAASIMESARLRPLAAFSVPQSAPTSRIIRGFMVPAGTNFIVDTYSLNIKNPFWGSDSETFRPTRFLEEKASRMRYHYWRFGFGPRQCIGKYVAEMMIRVLLVHLVENYELSLDANTPWEKNPSTWIQHPNTDIGCHRIADAGEMISFHD